MGFLYSQFFITPPYPKQSFSGQTVIVTGSNVGLGLEAARHFARLDAAKVILAVRNLDAGNKAASSIETSTKRPGVCEVWHLDLSSYDSVKAFAKRANSLPRLDVVVENAGVVAMKFSKAEQDERTVTVNVVSTFLLALLLIPKLEESAKKYGITPRLTIVTSEVHAWTTLDEWKSEKGLFNALSDEQSADMKRRYPDSKLLEVLYIRALAPRLAKAHPNIILNMLNPGLCHSELARDAGWHLYLMKLVLARSTEVGSRTLVASAAAGKESHGQYMSDAKVEDESLSPFVKSADGEKAGARVWEELNAKLDGIQPGILRAAGVA